MESNRSLINLIIDFIYIFQYDVIFNKMTFSNINLSNKALLIAVLVFLKVTIWKLCNIVISEDLQKLNDLYHLIRKFLSFSRLYLSLVNFFSIQMKRVFAFLYYTASFIVVIAIGFCQSVLGLCKWFCKCFQCNNDLTQLIILQDFLNFT